ncbi:hypothetical protein [uncultured Paludibaculum sp.]|uniref:hypothetical protein n=1 Tax=uncultured Paludibaculum sp. TaxID=1765020 RepID=UPI002AABACE3|nr:hypothetical protein [uncultured Paludibaculum sp.]
MTGSGCVCGPAPGQSAGRLSKVTASILPAALLLILPKCPLCIAAWLTVATGLSISAANITWVRAGILLLWMAAVAPVLWRRVLRRASASLRRRS